MRKLWIGLLATLILVFAVVPSAFAIDLRQGTSTVVEKQETVDDDVFLFGNTNIIEGTINGDVFAFGNDVLVRGTINGNLITAAQRVEILGHVTGTVFAAGDSIQLTGRVDRSLVAAGSRVTTDANSSVGHSLVVAADRMTHTGASGRGAVVAGNTFTVNGRIGKNLKAYVNNLTITGTVNGPVDYSSSHEATIAPGARTGEVHYTHVTNGNADVSFWWSRWWKALSFVGFVAFGMLVLALFPGLRRNFPQVLAEKPWQAPVTGAVTLVLFPVGFVVLLMTLIGIPVAIVALFALPVLIYVGQILLAFAVGRLLADRVEAIANWSWPGLFLVGAVLISLLKWVPGAGWFFSLVALLYGFGGIVWLLFARRSA